MAIDISKIKIQDRVQEMMKLVSKQIELDAKEVRTPAEEQELKTIEEDLRVLDSWRPEVSVSLEDPTKAADEKAKADAAASMTPSDYGTSVEYIKYSSLNIAEYINTTISLNPWGRERQCDVDLKDLLLHIDKEMELAASTLQEASTSIGNISTLN